ncbi:hypothetical protein M422DRAFT_54760 [Sphaerobolus stellatus SS14]|uniref:Uncharacterized protein n=1 Tax=Sphaerobolus stellatus (strain SS14) TaxID=990650 RepID=A0A0C9TFG2_SPHS4|nr:hypothetical protein M422DRAFT_54760 [Sphaerobolus stellatus SS14]
MHTILTLNLTPPASPTCTPPFTPPALSADSSSHFVGQLPSGSRSLTQALGIIPVIRRFPSPSPLLSLNYDCSSSPPSQAHSHKDDPEGQSEIDPWSDSVPEKTPQEDDSPTQSRNSTSLEAPSDTIVNRYAVPTFEKFRRKDIHNFFFRDVDSLSDSVVEEAVEDNVIDKLTSGFAVLKGPTLKAVDQEKSLKQKPGLSSSLQPAEALHVRQDVPMSRVTRGARCRSRTVAFISDKKRPPGSPSTSLKDEVIMRRHTKWKGQPDNCRNVWYIDFNVDIKEPPLAADDPELEDGHLTTPMGKALFSKHKALEGG